MPNRILKNSICSSETIERLSWFQEVVFYRLIVNCDDYGRMDARPKLLKSTLFPVKDNVTVKDVEDAVQRLADIGCVKLYEIEGRPYLYLPAWGLHQNIRAKKSKYPEPGKQVQTPSCYDKNDTSENICSQLNTDEYKCSRNPIQSNPIQSESEYEYMPEAKASDNSSFINLPLNDKSEFAVTEIMIAEWSELYPAVDIKQELRKMKGWLDSNPTKRKTKSGIKRFINSWLSREQDKGGSKNAVKTTPDYNWGTKGVDYL